MMYQKAYRLNAGGKTKVDLVKGWGTIAVIKSVVWVGDPDSPPSQDWRLIAALTATVYDNLPATALINMNTIINDDRVISCWLHSFDLTVEGSTQQPGAYRDTLAEPVEIVAPCGILVYEPDNDGSVMMRLHYDIVPASREKIIEVAARQGLVMEV